MTDRLLGRARERCRPAWIRLGRRGRVEACGGALEHHGLAGLGLGDAPLADVIGGLLPATAAGEELQAVELAPGRHADILVFVAAGSEWVVLLDAGARVERERRLHQAVNDLALLRHGTQRDACALLEALDLVVLVRRSEGRFAFEAPPPPWLGAPAGETVALAERFPCLERFLAEAERWWGEGGQGRLAAGPWTERDGEGREHAFHASALAPGGRRLVVVQRLGTALPPPR